jgi:hypothetical protein
VTPGQRWAPVRARYINGQLAPESDWSIVASILAAIPDYDDPPCKGNWEAYDYPDDAYSVADRNGETIPNRRLFLYYAEALDICASCPLATKQRCRTDQLAANPHFFGVAGGVVFKDGVALRPIGRKVA